MRYVSILIATSGLMVLTVACDGDIPERDVPRTLPPAHVGAAGVLREGITPARPAVPQGIGPIYETGAALKTG